MKKRNQFFLSELEFALYKEDPKAGKKPADEPAVAAAGDGTVEGDFVMTSGSDICSGCQHGYNERVAGGPGSSTTRPIHHEDEPERAILLMDLPKPESDWTMRVTLSNDELEDKIEMRSVTGVYSELFSELTSKFDLVHQEKGSFFTVFDTTLGKYITIMNSNQTDMVIRLEATKKNTFDVFRVSFLVLSGK